MTVMKYNPAHYDRPWVGIDFDGTLAVHPRGDEVLGEPIWPMVQRLRQLVADGLTVKIFTARMTLPDAAEHAEAINKWLRDRTGLGPFECTATKDMNCAAIYDDIAIGIIRNVGVPR